MRKNKQKIITKRDNVKQTNKFKTFQENNYTK